jgi:beta-lactamase regulating signal transducer with metallopeptidase domain
MNILPSVPFSSVEAWAQVAIERVIHSLPEGLLIALFAWAVLRVLPKQNSRTRFAVWFVALLAVVGIACVEESWITSQLPNPKVAKNATFGWGTLGFYSSRVSEIHLAAHWAGYLFIAWVVMASIGLARLVAGLWHLLELRRGCAAVNAAELDPAIAATMEALNAERSFAARRVTLASSERVRVPSALGLWKPVIVLPAWALAELPANELSIILRHEFAHLRRWDDWTNLVQKVVRAVFFFHPAVWWIESRLSVEREMACDDIVVAETDNPMGYASCLVNLLERSLAQRGWMMAQAIVHRAREASERVAQILDKNRPAGHGISKPALGLVGTFAALCVVMLPATPRFVTFDRGAVAEQGYSAGFARGAKVRAASYRELGRAAVIPAGLKTSESLKAVSAHAKTLASDSVVPQVSGQQTHANLDPITRKARAMGTPDLEHPQDREAEANSVSATESPIQADVIAELNPAADQHAMPRVVFVRETQFVTADVPVTELTIVSLPRGPMMILSVQMMRVTFVAPVWREQMQAKKI